MLEGQQGRLQLVTGLQGVRLRELSEATEAGHLKRTGDHHRFLSQPLPQHRVAPDAFGDSGVSEAPGQAARVLQVAGLLECTLGMFDGQKEAMRRCPMPVQDAQAKFTLDQVGGGSELSQQVVGFAEQHLGAGVLALVKRGVGQGHLRMGDLKEPT